MPGGEKGEVTMQGERRSRYVPHPNPTARRRVLVARIYERPTVQKPSQIAADVGGAHTITVEEVPELPSLRAACRIEALPQPQSPDLRHTRPHAVRGRVDSIQSHRPHRDEQLRQVWDVMYSGVHMTRNCLESARAIPMPMAGGLPLPSLAADGARLEAPRAVGEQQRPRVVLGPQPLHSLEQLRLALLPHQVHLPPPLPIYDVAVELEPPLALERP
eukprot:scaffold9123_cov121-Isochrysis_galbana.AAC.4